jgi:ferric-dicitrate binding protein FerR (iron transport regulator)
LRFARYAAIVVFALALPAILYQAYRHNPGNALITVSIAQTDSSKLVTLGDGTRVWLNSNSSITYPPKFSETHRTVQFTGEAYFEVAHNKSSPFHVQTNNVRVKVLGTSFNVRSYASGKTVETTLVEGKVAIQNNQGDDLATLTPGQMAAYDKASKHVSVKPVDPRDRTAWRYGVIALNNVPLNDIVAKLTELYQVDITTHGLDANHTAFNFSFRKSEPIDKVLEMLSFIAPVKYTIRNKEIIITAIQ